MRTNNIPFSKLNKTSPKIIPNLQLISYGIFSKGLKNEFETAVINEPLVFEPLKFYVFLSQTLDLKRTLLNHHMISIAFYDLLFILL